MTREREGSKSMKLSYQLIAFWVIFGRLLIFSKLIFEKILSGIPSECQTVWTLIRPDESSGLIWVHTVCQGYQQTTLIDKRILPVDFPQ